MASIAAGNYGVNPSYLGNDLGMGVISGIAPRARIAHYKAFWADAVAGEPSGAESDLVAAIDAAVADGVDILNYSIGLPLSETVPLANQSTMLDPESQAMLRAFDAGVLPVIPAGNGGEPETIDAPGHTPWTISAGASALSTTFAATATVSGARRARRHVPGNFTDAGAPAGTAHRRSGGRRPGRRSRAASRCEEEALDPDLVEGKAVLCQPDDILISQRDPVRTRCRRRHLLPGAENVPGHRRRLAPLAHRQCR